MNVFEFRDRLVANYASYINSFIRIREPRIDAVVQPMNALANSQYGELEKFLCYGYADGKGPVRFERYTGQEDDEKKSEIIKNPPDILLTNYVMLELILTRPQESNLIHAANGLR